MDEQQEALESLERYKEVARIGYDYYKSLATLSMASIGAILAFITKVFPIAYSSILHPILAGLSLICFSVCLGASIQGMPGPANLISHLTNLRFIVSSKNPIDKQIRDIMDISDKLRECAKSLTKHDRVAKYSFMLGVLIFLFYAVMSLIYKAADPGAGGLVK